MKIIIITVLYNSGALHIQSDPGRAIASSSTKYSQVIQPMLKDYNKFLKYIPEPTRRQYARCG